MSFKISTDINDPQYVSDLCINIDMKYDLLEDNSFVQKSKENIIKFYQSHNTVLPSNLLSTNKYSR